MKSLNLLVCCGVINHYYYSHVNNFSITLTFNPKLTIVYHYGVMLQQLSWINYGDFRKKRFVLFTMLPLMPPVMICFVNLTVSIYTNVIVIKYLFAHLLYSIPCSPLTDLLNLHIPNSSYALRSNYDYLCLKVPFPHKEMYKSSLSYSCSFLWNKLPIELCSNHSLASCKKDYILLNSITNDYRNLMA